MDISKMKDLFSIYSESDYLKFDKIISKFSKKRDLHAFILLDNMFPDDKSMMISNTRHDEINLYVDIEELSQVITEDKILELVRCGVSCYKSDDWLSMNV